MEVDRFDQLVNRLSQALGLCERNDDGYTGCLWTHGPCDPSIKRSCAWLTVDRDRGMIWIDILGKNTLKPDIDMSVNFLRQPIEADCGHRTLPSEHDDLSDVRDMFRRADASVDGMLMFGLQNGKSWINSELLEWIRST